MSALNRASTGYLALKNPPSGGSGGGSGTDAIARTAAASAQTNINAITPQPSEVIQPGERVYTAQGVFENATAAPITLGTTNPPTAVSLQADGLAEAQDAGETGTNFTIPTSTAFTSAGQPTAAEVDTWRTANAPNPSDGDLFLYTNSDGKLFTFAADDTANVSLISVYDPNAKGGLEVSQINAVTLLQPDFEYWIDTSALASDGNNLGLNTIDFPLAVAPVDARIAVIGKGTPYLPIHLVGTVEGDTGGLVINLPNRLVDLVSTGTGWLVARD